MNPAAKPFATLGKNKTVENPPGIFRTTLAYNDELMICHFRLNRGAEVPLHHHTAAQAGYVIRGRIRFFKKDGSETIAETGTGYAFESEEPHGAEALEDAEVIDCFTPLRPEYIDE